MKTSSEIQTQEEAQLKEFLDRRQEAFDMLEKLHKANPKDAERYWNNSPYLNYLGAAAVPEGEGPVTIGGKVVGYQVKLPDGTWHFNEAGLEIPAIHRFIVC
jgi:hypothetical protein